VDEFGYTPRMQRIVAGSLGGRHLLALPKTAAGVRPSSSRVRGAIFDRLQHEVPDARVLDLFAGSGALAIEALSRGAAEAVLVEQQVSLTRFLDRQLGALDLLGRGAVVRADARGFLDRGLQGRAAFDLVLVDPPYAELDLYTEVLARLDAHGWLAPSAVVVLEYIKRRGQRPAIDIPPGLESEAIRDHGQTAIEFLRARDTNFHD